MADGVIPVLATCLVRPRLAGMPGLCVDRTGSLGATPPIDIWRRPNQGDGGWLVVAESSWNASSLVWRGASGPRSKIDLLGQIGRDNTAQCTRASKCPHLPQEAMHPVWRTNKNAPWPSLRSEGQVQSTCSQSGRRGSRLIFNPKTKPWFYLNSRALGSTMDRMCCSARTVPERPDL